jgi:GT2 family glycosyltransferase/glycosyltransferase involved in cell wall biosynthesis
VAFYEVGFALHPTALVDITSCWEVKARAMAAYSSQLCLHRYFQVTEGLNRFRTLTLGQGVEYAEAFRLLPVATLEQDPMWQWSLGREEKKSLDSPPAVSVIVRTKDRPGFLQRALQSLTEQTFKDFEVIVVNDQGRDVSDLIKRFSPPLSLVYISHSENRGRGAALNSGLRRARGEFITYLDDDDIYYPAHLATLYYFLSRNDHYAVAYTDAHRAFYEFDFDKNNYILKERKVTYSRDFDRDALLYDNYIPILCLMHHRECLMQVGTYDEEMALFEDWDFFIRLSSIYNFFHIRKCTAEFSQYAHGSNVTLSNPFGSSGREYYRVKIFEKHQQRRTAKIENRVFEEQQSRIYQLLHEGERLRQENTELHQQSSALAQAVQEGERLRQENTELHQQLSALAQTVQEGERLRQENTELRQQLSALAQTVQEGERLHLQRIALEQAARENRFVGKIFAVLRFGLQLSKSLIVLLLRGVLCAISIPFSFSIGIGLLLCDITAKAFCLRIREKPSEQPMPQQGRTGVSVIIPSWNGKELLAMTLPAVIKAVLEIKDTENEIILIDNGSDDGSVEYIRQNFPQIRLISLPTNKGFAAATNIGVRESRNRIVVLLNNDMVVDENFLDPLLEVFRQEPNVFGVSCHIYFWDETKPRWETGKVHGRLHNGFLDIFHLYRYAEDRVYPVLYAGGGASAYDKAKFLALGGFDEKHFTPVYIEDVDLGYRAWKRGWPSFFQPRSVAYHKHRSTTRRLYSERDMLIFFKKNLAFLFWKNVTQPAFILRHLLFFPLYFYLLQRREGLELAFGLWFHLLRQFPRALLARFKEYGGRVLRDEDIFLASRYRYFYRELFHQEPSSQTGEKLRVLMITPYSPAPAVHGGAVRIYNLLKQLQPVCDVTLVTHADTPVELQEANVQLLRQLCREVSVIWRDLNARGGFLLPSKTHGFFSQEMKETIEYYLDKDDFHIIQADYTQMAHFLPISKTRPVILVEHDLTFVAQQRRLKGARSGLEKIKLFLDWMRTLRYEISWAEKCDVTVTMSEDDKRMLGAFIGEKRVAVIPNGVDCQHFAFVPDGRESGTLLFVGFFRHDPNEEAALYFYHRIFPLVRKGRNDVRFCIVGAYPPEEIKKLGTDPAVEVIGQVEDIVPYYQKYDIFVAPILRGSGTRLKILEAMASGCPVVSTTIGAEGLGVTPGKELLVGDDPQAMAEGVLRFLSDVSLRERVVHQARTFVEQNYSWEKIAQKQIEVYDQALRQKRMEVHEQSPHISYSVR